MVPPSLALATARRTMVFLPLMVTNGSMGRVKNSVSPLRFTLIGITERTVPEAA